MQNKYSQNLQRPTHLGSGPPCHNPSPPLPFLSIHHIIPLALPQHPSHHSSTISPFIWGGGNNCPLNLEESLGRVKNKRELGAYCLRPDSTPHAPPTPDASHLIHLTPGVDKAQLSERVLGICLTPHYSPFPLATADPEAYAGFP